MMAEATLVCKGEVVEAPSPVFVRSLGETPKLTATAQVRPDRCFKGKPAESLIPVLFDGLLPAAGGPSFVLRKGDYLLLFLRQQEGQYAVVDRWFGALQVSRKSAPEAESRDSRFLLELDLKEGLTDSDPELVLDSIRMLGNMKQLHSTAELRNMLGSDDLLLRTYVWQALLRLKDYEVLAAVADFFDSQPVLPTELQIPRDRLFQMHYELEREVAQVKDPSTLSYLQRFASKGRDSGLRSSALQALRAIGSPSSAATFLTELDDPNSDNAFSAMQGLLALAPGSQRDWVPTWKQFDEAPQTYAAKCREWWNTDGKNELLRSAQR